MTRCKFILLAIFGLISHVATCQDTIQQKINYYISQAKLDSAKLYIQTNLDKLSEQEDKTTLNYQLVKVLFMQSSYNEALKRAFSSLDVIEDEQQKVKFNFLVGCIYSAISDYDVSVEYFDLVVEHNRDSSLTVQTQLLLSQLHLELGDTIKATKSIDKAYGITNNSNLDPKIKSHVAMLFSFYNANYELCKQENFKIIKDSTSFLNSKSYAYSMIGECLIKQDSLKKASTYFDEFLKLTFETKDPEQIKVAANKLIEVYEKLGNQEKANAYHKIYNEAVNDSLSFSLDKYRALYDLEKNRALEADRAESVKRYLFFGLMLVLIISIGGYFVWKRKLHRKKRLDMLDKTPVKKIVISDKEIEKIVMAIDQLKRQQLFLKANITRKSFCSDSDIKSERYLSHYINEEYKNSFSVFINELRIAYAHERIQHDKKFRNYKIEEIAKECGFGSKKSFERAFFAKYKETPYKLISRLIS